MSTYRCAWNTLISASNPDDVQIFTAHTHTHIDTARIDLEKEANIENLHTF